MRSWGRFVLVFIAYGLALLHTAVPHQHVASTNGKITISQSGCVPSGSMGGLLQLVFSTDLGYGHLETFQKNAKIDIDYSFAGVSLVALLVPLLLLHIPSLASREFYGDFMEKLQKRLLLFSSLRFRGPPAVN